MINLEAEFQRYKAAAYDGKNLHEIQEQEIRRAFIAGIHLAACRIKNGDGRRTARAIVEATLAFAKTLLFPS